MLSLWALDLLLQLAPASLPRTGGSRRGLDGAGLRHRRLAAHGARVRPGPGGTGVESPQSSRSYAGRGAPAPGRGHARVRRALIMLECAIAVVLLVSGALLVRSFWHLQRVDPGFDPRAA